MAMTGGTEKLVKTGYGNGSTSNPINVYVYYKSSQDTATNTSTVYVGMYVTTPSSSYDIGPWVATGDSYVGTTSLTFSGAIPNFAGTRWLVENKSFTVKHDDEGKGSATIYWKWAVNSSWAGIQNPSGSFEIDLPTIPRVSVPTVSSSSVTMGNNLTIYTNRKSSSFTHTLKYTFGSKTETIATGVGDSHLWKVPDLASYCNNKTSGTCTITCTTYNDSTKVGEKTCTVTLNVPSATTPTLPTSNSTSPKYAGGSITISLPRGSSNFKHTLTYSFSNASGTIGEDYTTSASWTIPYALCSQIPSAWSGSITITCTTYNGTAKVGDTTVSLYFKVPDNNTTKPTVSNISLAPVSSLASPFSDLYIQGLTKVKATYTTSAPYSSVSKVEMSVQSKTVIGSSTTATSGFLSSNGSNVVVSFTVTNARGQTNTGSATISTIYAYTKPRVAATSGNTKALCDRGDEDGTIDTEGVNLVVKAKKDYSSINGNNTCYLWYRIKPYDGLPFSKNAERTTLLSESSSGSEYASVISGLTLSTTTSYTVEVGVTDRVSGDASVVFFIRTTETTFHLAKGGKGASFGGYSKGDGLEVPWKSTFTGAVHGKVYGLGSLPVIPQNSDINNYTTPGTYSVASNDYAQTMTNLPNKKAGTLIVSSADGSGRSNGQWAYLLQEYILYDGTCRYIRFLMTGSVADKWAYGDWKCNGSTYWKDLGLSSSVGEATLELGINGKGCFYRVVNENHVFVTFNCSFTYSGDIVLISGSQIPSSYKPVRTVFALCPVNDRGVARIFVNNAGAVYVDYVQNMASDTTTSAFAVNWIDGYIDYWI